jgi:protein-disulfide isomerase/uncharacterized membrane protein
MKIQKKINPLPFPVYFGTIAVIALAGFLTAAYLAIAHYRVYTDMGYKSFCAVSKSINCDTVSQSTFSIFFDVPVPIWGMVGYVLFLVLLYPARQGASNQARHWPTLFIFALGFSLYSIVLALISMVYIHSYCIMCIASYAVNFMLLFYTWLVHKRFADFSMAAGIKNDFQWMVHKGKKVAIIFLCISVGISMSLVLWTPHYWEISSLPQGYPLANGMTDDGHPWIGAENPEFVIVEFTDYQCFQCKKMHFYLRELIASYPDKIRLVHRNFPMDHAFNPLVKKPFHVGSGKLALISLYAAEKKNFWQVSDMLFNVHASEGTFHIRGIADAVGFDMRELAGAVKDPVLRQKLNMDLRDGLKLGITGTPGYVIDNQLYVGQIPPEILARVMR